MNCKTWVHGAALQCNVCIVTIILNKQVLEFAIYLDVNHTRHVYIPAHSYIILAHLRKSIDRLINTSEQKTC